MEENEAITPEVVEDDFKTAEIAKVGQGLPGPGRPKGLVNRYTKIKNDLLEVWDEENGKEIVREMLRSKSFRERLFALKIIVDLLPKEILAQLQLERPVTIMSTVTVNGKPLELNIGEDPVNRRSERSLGDHNRNLGR